MKKKVNKHLAIWAAGFFDGEGCISIAKSKSKTHKRGYSHFIRVDICQCEIKPLKILQKSYGGKLGNYTTSNSKRVNKLSFRKNEIEYFLSTIQKYSICKNREIILALQFLKTLNGKGSKAVSDKVFKQRDDLWSKCRKVKEVKYGTRVR